MFRLRSSSPDRKVRQDVGTAIATRQFDFGHEPIQGTQTIPLPTASRQKTAHVTLAHHMLRVHPLVLSVCCLPWMASVAAAEHGGLDRPRLREGWISLFDGESLYGWKATSSADWQVRDGAIVVDDGDPGWIFTTSDFADFELRLEFRCGPRTNSGVFLRSAVAPQDPSGDCYEVNLAPATDPFPTGSLVARLRTETICPANDNWRELVVRAVGPEIRIRVDDRETVRYVDPSPLGRGRIGLQYRYGPVQFRRILLRPLGLQPILAVPEDLQHWRTHPELGGAFDVDASGVLHVRGGPGQLEYTGREFADFVLQLECRTNAAGSNSGIFFRCLPGDRMMGYESQIHNGFDQRRDRPTDAGTGAIFRRCPARQVVPNDGEWFTKTIVACGPHMAVWVDGYQVSDWKDDRPDRENPRMGRRLAAGTLMIQAHDPSTDLDFRSLRAAELPARP